MNYQQFHFSYGEDDGVEDYYSPTGNVLFSKNSNDHNGNSSHFTKPDYYDSYDDINLQNQYDQSNVNMNIHGEPSFWSDLTFHQLCTKCILPAVWSTFNLLGTTLILCIVFRLFIVISKQYILFILSFNTFKICSIILDNRFKIVHEQILHIVCAICGVLPIILFHEDGDLYQLLLQIILFPTFCYIVSIICILYLKRHCSIVFSAIILLTLLYR